MLSMAISRLWPAPSSTGTEAAAHLATLSDVTIMQTLWLQC